MAVDPLMSPPADARRSDPYGSTRTNVCARHALLTADGIVPSALPGWTKAACYVTISPAMGSRFSQLRVEMDADGSGKGSTEGRQMVVYVLSGTLMVETKTPQFTKHRLRVGGFIYLPPGTNYHLAAAEAKTNILIFDKQYQPLAGVDAPKILVGSEQDVAGAPFLGDPAAMLQVLLPDTPNFDMAVNVFKYAPGATLPFVETHIMVHGLVMLGGEGIYRLEESWYPVRAGDAIWMAPYCPQWFVATGKEPASYIYYKDVNRWP